MNLRTIKLLSGLFLSIFILSCGNKKDKTGLLIPKDAVMAFHISGSSISSKIDWKEVANSQWFRKMYEMSRKENDTMALKFMDNPDISGVDIHSDMVYFIGRSENKGYMVFEGKLKDKAAFSAMAAKNSNLKPTEENGFSTLSMGLEGVLVWNDTRYAYVFNMPLPSTNPYTRRRQMGTSENEKFSPDKLKTLGRETLTLGPTQTLGTDERFASLFKEEGDMHFWVNTEKVFTEQPQLPFQMMNLEALTKGYAVGMSLNFGNGKITLRTKQYYGKELSGLAKKYDAREVKASLINRIPAQDPMLVMAFNFPPEALKDLVTILGVDSYVNIALASQKISLDDIIKATKGEGIFAVSDFSEKEISDTMDIVSEKPGKNQKPMVFTHKVPDGKILFATAINDKKAFDRLAFLFESYSKRKGPVSEFTNYKMNNEWFVAGNPPEDIDKFMAGGNNHFSFADAISGNPFGGYINLHKIIQQQTPKDTADAALMSASLDIWQDIIMTGGRYKDGGINSTIEVNMVNKTDNSLKQLNHYFDKLESIFGNDLERMMKRQSRDSLKIRDIEVPLHTNSD